MPKILSEVPFEDLKVGDRVISALGSPGRITFLTPEGKVDEYSPNGARYDAVGMLWDHGAKSYLFHMNADALGYKGQE